jgi:hypothetical protein
MPNGELSDLTFRAEDHRYFWRGKPVMNVTRALALITDYSKVDPAVLARAQQEGIDMHRMSDLHWKGELHVASLPEWLVPRRDALLRFEAETGFVPIASESRVYNAMYDYAGQLDMVGRLRKTVGRKEVLATSIVDLKRSFYGGRAIGFQTCAYLHAWNGRCGKDCLAFDRYALQLRADATYRLEPFINPNDWPNFLAILTTAKIKESMQ